MPAKAAFGHHQRKEELLGTLARKDPKEESTTQGQREPRDSGAQDQQPTLTTYQEHMAAVSRTVSAGGYDK
ncbi:hypothetical protein Y1Q_0020003 [Alligator mississippiensis]|uniref:Uncharacterized protein n=1 Tax=Alligator mississippiensis TaxID=8496 RepID=A0A151LYQ6_ALLMI|nr:hypothetical protein Y1Q_0020003 [Alligator mississippiensis]